MKSTKNKIIMPLLVLFLIVISLINGLIQAVMLNDCIAYAADTGYSDVLDDLHKDSTFNESYYPEIKDNYSIDIIQLAESTEKELLVYVYQPSGHSADLRATSINISTTSYADISPSNYKLKYLNSNSVFFKYVVDGITVSDATARYYGVTSIYRPFNKEYGDREPGHGNTVTEIPFNISKEYRFSTINGNPVAATVDIETIEITDKFVGFVRYSDGFKFFGDGACDSHFVAFSTNRPIDKLCEAKVSWVEQFNREYFGVSPSDPYYGDSVSKERELSIDDETVHYKGEGINAGTYEWERIQSVDDFMSSVDISNNVYSGAIINVNVANKIDSESKKILESKQWVLRFAETKYEYNSSGMGWANAASTLVGDVTILRLKFITDDITYNLGVIDNKQTGSNKPVNDMDISVTVSEKFSQFWKSAGKIILIVLVIIGIILLIAFVPGVLNLVLLILKAIFTPFKLAFKGIKYSIQKRKKRSE